MSSFDLLMLVSIVAAVVALARLRTATFIFAANQTIILRSLSLIEEHGRPAILNYVPVWVFHQENLRVAAVIFTISTALLAVCVALPKRHDEPSDQPWPAVPRPVLGLLALYFVVLALSSRTIFAVQYASPEQGIYSAPNGGVEAFAVALLIYELYRRIRARVLARTAAFCVLAGVLLFTDILKGLTGQSSGFLIAGAVLFFGGRKPSATRWAPLLGLLAGIVLVGSIIRFARLTIYESGSKAISDAVMVMEDREKHKDELGEGVETASSGHEFAALTLECITLYNAGNDRQWRSVYLPLLYTFEPAFIDQLMGWERTKEAAQEIREYFATNGAATIFGEAYWNGGYLAVLLIIGSLLFACYQVDRSYRHGFVPLLMYCNFAPIMLQGVGYGISYGVRGLMNGLLQVALYFAWIRFLGKRGVSAMQSPLGHEARRAP